jgi:ATP-dependent HslUV protease ATP-binding subunit HslU
VSFAAPDVDQSHVVVDAAYVDAHLGGLAGDDDLSRYIL